MELSTTSKGKQSFCGVAMYIPSTERKSKHCPTSVYTDLLPANPLLTTFAFKYAYKEYFVGFTKMSSYQNVQLSKCPVTKMYVTKTSITNVSFTKTSGYLLRWIYSTLDLAREAFLSSKFHSWPKFHS